MKLIKKSFLILFFAAVILNAEQIEIISDNFEADEGKRISKFIGNVKVKKGKDVITSDKLVIKFDEKKNPTTYEATGKAKFRVKIKDKNYKGKAKKIIYEPNKQIYIFIGDAFLNEIETNKKLYGEKIQVDESTGKHKVVGKKNRPVKFIFKVNEK